MTFEIRFSKLLSATPDQLAQIDALLEGHGRLLTEPGDRKLFTFTAAASTIGVSRQTIWRMVRAGRLPTVEIRAGRRRIPSSALTNLLQGVSK